MAAVSLSGGAGTGGCAAEQADGPEATTVVAEPINGITPNIIWNDEFESGSLDRSKWVPSDSSKDPGNNSGSCFNSNELQSYKDWEGCGAGANTICQYNGYLHLVARYYPNPPGACGWPQNYVSARLTTKSKYQWNPGMGNNGIRVEARINFPQMTSGVFPAFWMLGADVAQWPNPGSVNWPQSGEIDIAEWGSAWSSNNSLGTLHYADLNNNHQMIGSYSSPWMNSNDWHTYAVEWTWSSIKWLVDGNQMGPTVYFSNYPGQDFTHDFSVILNNAVGGDGGGGVGIDPNLTSQSTSSSGSGFDSHQRMAVDYVRVYALNNDNGWTARVFQGTGQYNAALPTEWDQGFYKGDCGAAAALNGLSTNVSGGVPHAMLCTNYGSQFSGNLTATLSDVSTAEHRRATRDVYVVGQTDWDNGYYKTECALNEYVSGISQDPSTGNIHGVRCASAPMSSNGTAGCETHLVTQEDRGYSGDGDWDNGYYKGECGWGKSVVGVSASPSSRKPHKILCCNN
jgi:beta-glucanase (GH16 family)